MDARARSFNLGKHRLFVCFSAAESGAGGSRTHTWRARSVNACKPRLTKVVPADNQGSDYLLPRITRFYEDLYNRSEWTRYNAAKGRAAQKPLGHTDLLQVA